MRSDKYRQNRNRNEVRAKADSQRNHMVKVKNQTKRNSKGIVDTISDTGKSIKKPRIRRKKKRSVFRKLIAIVLILAILVGVALGAGYKILESKVSKMDYVETTIGDFAIEQSVDDQLSDYRNIAILGIDAREGERSADTRTDAIIIASINKSTGEITLTSVMRDTYIQMDYTTGEEILDKATHANVYGGAVNTCKMLNKAMDLNISEFVMLDWKAVADTVDALGGITVDVQENEIWDLNHWGPETAANTGREQWTAIENTGVQKINGVQAATYCRIRKNSGGDTGRTERMRKVIIAVLNEIKEHPTKALDVADKVFPEIMTNMNTSQIASLIPKALKFEISENHGYPFSYWGGYLNGIWYAVPTTLEENAIMLHKEVFGNSSYIPSERLNELNQLIINDTGISQGTETNK